jgi:hypothetical protein
MRTTEDTGVHKTIGNMRQAGKRHLTTKYPFRDIMIRKNTGAVVKPKWYVHGYN